MAETEIAIAFNFQEDVLEIPTECDDEDSGKYLEAGRTRRTLRLAVSQDSMPIYSFLPTKTAAFKFIVQADFILATNRESIREQDPYNQQLIAQLIRLISDIFEEFSAFLQYNLAASGGDGGAPLEPLHSPPYLASLLEISDRNKLVLTPAAVVALLPRPFSCAIHKEI